MSLEIRERRSPVSPAGRDEGAWSGALEQVSVPQAAAPLEGFTVYLVGFRCAKNDPAQQAEVHHYCRVVNDDLLQCVLFDGNTPEANLVGVEYIVSGRLFDTLPEEEKSYWHPHNFEVLSGRLAAPGLSEEADKALCGLLMNSYGKTWHTWRTGRHDGRPGLPLPLGEPALMWSFNRRGECDESLEHDRDAAMGVDVDGARRRRRSLVELAHPQHGVDALAGDFGDTSPIPGVVDVHAAG